MTQNEVIQTVQDFTEHRLDTQINWNRLFWFRLQRVCKTKHFPFRRKTLTFSTAVGVALYDLSSTATVTPNGALDVDEIVKVLRIDSSGPPPVATELLPIFDAITTMRVRRDTTQDNPVNYFREPGTFYTLRLTPIPVSIVPIDIVYWATPNPAADASGDAIVILPPFDHDVLVAGMVMDADKLIFGVESQKYLIAKQEYTEALEGMLQRRDFSVDRHDTFAVTEDAPNSSSNQSGVSAW